MAQTRTQPVVESDQEWLDRQLKELKVEARELRRFMAERRRLGAPKHVKDPGLRKLYRPSNEWWNTSSFMRSDGTPDLAKRSRQRAERNRLLALDEGTYAPDGWYCPVHHPIYSGASVKPCCSKARPE